MNGGGEGASASAAPPLEWKFSQVFGERTAGEEVQEGKSLLFSICFRDFWISFSDVFLLIDFAGEVCLRID